MDPGDTLLKFLDQTVRNEAIPFEQRDGAAYIAALFRADRNTSRLIVQLDALLRGQEVVKISPQFLSIDRTNSVTQCNQTAVQRYGIYLHDIVTEFNIIPTIADFEAHPVRFSDNLEMSIESALDGERKLKFRQALLIAQQKANSYLARFSFKYGYHYIFRMGLGQYYMT